MFSLPDCKFSQFSHSIVTHFDTTSNQLVSESIQKHKVDFIIFYILHHQPDGTLFTQICDYNEGVRLWFQFETLHERWTKKSLHQHTQKPARCVHIFLFISNVSFMPQPFSGIDIFLFSVWGRFVCVCKSLHFFTLAERIFCFFSLQSHLVTNPTCCSVGFSPAYSLAVRHVRKIFIPTQPWIKMVLQLSTRLTEFQNKRLTHRCKRWARKRWLNHVCGILSATCCLWLSSEWKTDLFSR